MKMNKFGLDMLEAAGAYLMAKKLPAVSPIGIDCHIGSQLTEIDPFVETLEKLLAFIDRLKVSGIDIRYLDLGGGLGITYDEETPPQPADLGRVVAEAVRERDLTVILEPGRAIAGNAGILVTKVLYTKKTRAKNFVIVDAAMNDLVRPSLYGAYHHIAEVAPKARKKLKVDVVGPICESSDFLAQDRLLPEVASGELLAVLSAGAYGFSMSSQYNARPRAAEVIVDNDRITQARRRETYTDLVALEG
jgi:diaminopimelate decarboxylase